MLLFLLFLCFLFVPAPLVLLCLDTVIVVVDLALKNSYLSLVLFWIFDCLLVLPTDVWKGSGK